MVPYIRASITNLAPDLTESDLDRIRLAVTEACANVVRHAYPDDTGILEVGACLGPSSVVIDVRDAGIGPRESSAQPEPGHGGLGLPLIGMLADRVEITPHEPGTSVRMIFELR
ncbi:MAG TPA: ATP-binding protein [Gaiellales bacterium]|nr:ATP-binding protein [Gaiellales bacterium]